jgi:dsDNA-specific endonuclease/ATPase MutS2
MSQSDVERFVESDKSKGEQITKLASVADMLRQENHQLRENMAREMESLKKQHEEEMQQQEQEATESIAMVQQSIAEQSEEMKKFGDFIKLQSETVKQ